MIIETFFYNKIAERYKDKKCDTYKMSYMAFIISKIISMSIALYLSWICNKKKSMMIRSLFILFAFLFSDIFIIYYIIYYLIMKNKCE